MAKGKDQRSTRFPITQLVDVSNNKEDFYHAQGINISETGLLCETDEALDIHSEIYIMLTIDGEEEALELQGSVSRVEKKGKKFQVGIKFNELIEEDLELLEKFIQANK
jgi:Tfp pilus assembly protein PilZ